MRTFNKLLRQHPKLVTLIGTLTLFLTFLIKEGFRERAKDHLDAFTAAQSAYRQNKNHRDEMVAIEAGPHMRNVVAAASPIRTKGEAFGAAEEYIANADEQELSDIQGLTASMPNSPDLSEKRNTVAVERKKALDMFAGFYNDFSVQTQNEPSTPGDKNFVNHLSEQMAAVTDATNNYTYAVLDAAKVRNKYLEKRYENFTFASYFLFTFGLVISLLGKLLEPSGKAADVEG